VFVAATGRGPHGNIPENVAVVPSGDACTWQLSAKWQEFFQGRKQQSTHAGVPVKTIKIRKIENELIKFHHGILNYLASYIFMFCYNSKFILSVNFSINR